ncbi:hypothetical protein H5410_035250 [Solanum commersonii]|uniref:Carboxypeptidase A inhibitor-like domain-containing protein n=1 Tax=Solanum commersonii TaxID=4109 RepID=A0A9J5Y251_SOLCO|nr:hypothetical protein H5410_035250 [Solanum commersonii]
MFQDRKAGSVLNFATHDNRFYFTKIHVMAQNDVLPMVAKLIYPFDDPFCYKPCKRDADCSGGSYCNGCLPHVGCGPYFEDAMAMVS